MRVGLVCPYDLSKPGGVQSQVIGLQSALGEDAFVIGPGLPTDIPGFDLGRTVGIPGNGSIVPLVVDPRVRSLIKSAAREADLLHVHEPLMPLVSLNALRVGKPVLATFHAAPGIIGRRLYGVMGAGLRRVLGGNVRRMTAVSEVAAAPLSKHLDVTIVPNGVDTHAFQTDIKRVPGRVAFLGRDEPRKGLDILMGAWTEVATRMPAAQLVVVGANRDLPGIDWRGHVDDQVKQEVLGSSSVFVAPNIGGESFGIVLVEAMAAGDAIVASDLDSFRAVAGGVARFFAAGDSAALASALLETLEDEGEARRLGTLGKDRAKDYDWSRVVEAYLGLYEETLS